MIKTSISILDCDFNNLEYEINRVNNSNSDLIHIDIMDGHYVPNITFGPNIVKSLRSITNKVLAVSYTHLTLPTISDV